MRLLVTGANGQIARALRERGAPGMRIHRAVARAELDLAATRIDRRALRRSAPDVVVNAAAYTAVDKAESEREVAFAVNERGRAGGGAGRGGAWRADHPALDRLRVRRDQGRPYVESDPVAPISAYGAASSRARGVAAANPSETRHRAPGLGLQPVRREFRAHHAAPGRRARSASRWSPTSAAGPPPRSTSPTPLNRWRPISPAYDGGAICAGVFHIEAPTARRAGPNSRRRSSPARARAARPPLGFGRSPRSDYPNRQPSGPANSRLDAGKLAAAHGVRLPPLARIARVFASTGSSQCRRRLRS